MIRNYLLLFARNLRRQKLFSLVNLLGLTVSIVSTTLIYLYVSSEFSYDAFHHHVDRIYRVNQTFIWGEGDNAQFSSTGPGVAMALKEELPEMELITSIHTPGNFVISYTTPSNEVISFEEERVFAGDTSFFRMFNFPLVNGESETALRQANTLVMTESTAAKYFGTENPIGKLVTLGRGKDLKTYEVTGVVKDLPENSYIRFDVMLSLTGFGLEKRHWSWVWTQLETYIRLAPGTDVENTKAKLTLIPRKHAETSIKAAMGMSYDEYTAAGKKWELFLQPMTSIHLPAVTVYNRLGDPGNIKILYALIGAAGFIVLLSCINFMNLSTAQFTRRLKEVSIRKIMGLGKVDLSINYLLEAFAFCFIALAIAIGITQLLLPAFSNMIGKQLELNLLGEPILVIGLLSLIIFMALLSASYPAFFLTAFHPAEAIKGKLKIGSKGRTFRNTLVVFQFLVSFVLMMCTAVVYDQLKFVSETDLGFDKENLLMIKHVENINDGESFAHEAMTIPRVVASTWCTSVPPEVYGGDSFIAEGTNGITLPLNFTTADERFIPTMGINVIVGRNFRADAEGDINRVIINQAALKEIGWPEDETVIGRKISKPGEETYEVVGVMEDFHYWSLQSPIEPMALFHIENTVSGAGDSRFVTLRMAAQNSESLESAIANVHTLWKKHAGDFPFQYEFVDDKFAESFKTQQQFANTLTVMAGLAILIAGLGLFGMVIYTLEQRTKEIGIRKVAGATVFNILALISKGYTRLIVIAFIIGAPLSYWMMGSWLENFAYRVTISVSAFVWIGVGTLLVAILITGYHSVKSALMSPVKVLRDE
jgi:putative ABC transport system permease protein